MEKSKVWVGMRRRQGLQADAAHLEEHLYGRWMFDDYWCCAATDLPVSQWANWARPTSKVLGDTPGLCRYRVNWARLGFRLSFSMNVGVWVSNTVRQELQAFQKEHVLVLFGAIFERVISESSGYISTSGQVFCWFLLFHESSSWWPKSGACGRSLGGCDQLAGWTGLLGGQRLSFRISQRSLGS